jgi:hypothetical protein
LNAITTRIKPINAIAAAKYRDSFNFENARLNKSADPPNPNKYITKVDMIGAAAFMQGYPARDGFGITRIKNQTVDPIPRIIKANLV